MTTRVPYAMLSGPANVLAFGAKGDGVTDDTDALQAALTAHKRVVLPSGHTYLLDGTLTLAQDDAELVIEAGAELRHTPSATKGIILSGARGRISGPGTFRSLGTRDATNTEALYACVWITGDGCVVDGVRFAGVPKAGVKFYNAGGGAVHDCRFDGEFPVEDFVGTNTAHFAVVVDPTVGTYQGQVSVTGNHFRRFVSAVAWGNFGDANDNRGLLVSGNLFMDCHDHGVYAENVRGAAITGNTFDRCAVAVVVRGRGCTVSGNSLYNVGAVRGALDRPGLSLRDPQDCTVTANTVVGNFPADDYVAIGIDSISETTIRNNVVANNAVINMSAFKATAIRLGTALTEVCENNVIAGNVLEGQAQAFDGLIALAMKPTFLGKNNAVTGNTIRSVGANYAANLSAQRYLTFSGNSVGWEYDAPGAATGIIVNVNDCDEGVFNGNLLRCTETGANVTLRGFSLTGTASNLFTGNHVVTAGVVGVTELYNPAGTDVDVANFWTP